MPTKDCWTDFVGFRRQQKTAMEFRLRLVLHLGEVRTGSGKQRQRAEECAHGKPLHAAARHHHVAHADRELNHLRRVIAPLGFIGVEEPVAETTRHDRGKLPGEIVRIAHAAVHALAGKRRRQMRCIAGQKYPIRTPAVGHARVKGVNHFAAQYRLVIGSVQPQQSGNVVLRQNVGILLAVVEHQLETARAVRAGQRKARPRRVAIDLGVAGRIGGLFQIDDEPPFPEGRAVHLNAKLLAYEAATAVAADQVIARQVKRLAAVTNVRRYGFRRLREFDKLRLEHDGRVAQTHRAVRATAAQAPAAGTRCAADNRIPAFSA